MDEWFKVTDRYTRTEYVYGTAVQIDKFLEILNSFSNVHVVREPADKVIDRTKGEGFDIAGVLAGYALQTNKRTQTNARF